MAVKLHRCRWVGYRFRHPCWTVQEALDERGVEYEIVTEPTFPRGRRKEVIEHTGQHFLPAIELEDGTWWREDSRAMAEAIRAGRLADALQADPLAHWHAASSRNTPMGYTRNTQREEHP